VRPGGPERRHRAADLQQIDAEIITAQEQPEVAGDATQAGRFLRAVADEEAGGRLGAEWLIEHEADAVRADYCITEAGGFALPLPSANGPRLPVVVAEKGVYWCTLRVKGTLANGEGKLRPGLFARADLGVSHREGVLMIPSEAILERSDGKVVFRLVNGDHVERRVVKTGVYKGGRVEIVEGLAQGDHVVTRGHTALVDGAVVLVRNADGSAGAPDVASGAAPAPERAE